MSSGLSMVLRWVRPWRRHRPGRMSRGTPGRHRSRLVGAVISLGCPLHPLLVRSRSLWPPLVEEIERFSGGFCPLVHGFKPRQGWTLICGTVLLTNEAHLNRMQWAFVLRVSPCTSRAEDSQGPLSFFLLLLDPECVQLHGDGLSHLTLKIF